MDNGKSWRGENAYPRFACAYFSRDSWSNSKTGFRLAPVSGGIKRAIYDTRRPVFDRRLKKSKLSNWDVFFSFSLKFVREEISSSIFSRINFKSKRFLFFFFDIFVIFVVSLTFIAKVRTKIQVSNHEHLGDDQDEAKVASRIILAERILVVYGRLEFERRNFVRSLRGVACVAHYHTYILRNPTRGLWQMCTCDHLRK